MRKMKEDKKIKPDTDVIWMKGMDRYDTVDNRSGSDFKKEEISSKYIKIDIRLPKVKVVDKQPVNIDTQQEEASENDQKNYLEYFNAHKMMVLMDVTKILFYL